MTVNNVLQYQPTIKDGMVLVEKKIYDELRKGYVRACVLADIAQSEKDFAEGKFITADEMFTKLKAKYGY